MCMRLSSVQSFDLFPYLFCGLVTYEENGDTKMAPANAASDDQEYPCIIKVTDGEDLKFSTRVRNAFATIES